MGQLQVQPELREVAALEPVEVLNLLQTSKLGLSADDAGVRRQRFGSNSIHSHGFTWLSLIGRQIANPILILLAAVAAISGFLGETGSAITIAVILFMSVGLSFVTEFRAERASADMQARTAHTATVIRAGANVNLPITDLVPGDLVRLKVGSIVPAEMRVVEASNLECDESIMTGESLPVSKASGAGPISTNCLLMGTVVRAGSCLALVVRTGNNTQFGQIAGALSRRPAETVFQRGLRGFGLFLLRVAISMAAILILGNLILGRLSVDTVLFALALSVGLTPQLLPAIVSTTLAFGSRRLTKSGVLVKHLMSLEDLGDMDVLLSDKTGTLTTGDIEFESAIQYGKRNIRLLGKLASEVDYRLAETDQTGLNAIDAALWRYSSDQDAEIAPGTMPLAQIPFDHERRLNSVLIELGETTTLICKGAPEDIFSRCKQVPDSAKRDLSRLYKRGARVIAVATKSMKGAHSLSLSDENDLQLEGLLIFSDPVKESAAESLRALSKLGIELKIATGDSSEVAIHVCELVGLPATTAMTGVEVDALSDTELGKVARSTTIFARVSPLQKARILRALRSEGQAVGFLGDGVNDSIALHDADIGISVDSAADVARDAADVVLLEKDLGVLANGVTQGRRVFNNTMKYVLMGTAGDFGNMVSAGIGSVLLPFLPMSPSQILLQDLLYDASQMGIPSDRVDPEQVSRPSHWQVGFIRRFMLVFGLISSIFDLATFALLLWVLGAGETEFQTGWFIESLATAILVVLVVRTRRVPFLRSKPSAALVITVLGAVLTGMAITYSPAAALFGFTPLPIGFFAALVGVILCYLVLVETAKKFFLRSQVKQRPSQHRRGQNHRLQRRSARFSSHRLTTRR